MLDGILRFFAATERPRLQSAAGKGSGMACANPDAAAGARVQPSLSSSASDMQLLS